MKLMYAITHSCCSRLARFSFFNVLLYMDFRYYAATNPSCSLITLELKEWSFYTLYFFFCLFHCPCWLETSNYQRSWNWPGCFFHNLLVPPLDGALSLIQPQGITMFISQYLQKKNYLKKKKTFWPAGQPQASMTLNRNKWWRNNDQNQKTKLIS